MPPLELVDEPGVVGGGGPATAAEVAWTAFAEVLDAGWYRLHFEVSVTTPGSGELHGFFRFSTPGGTCECLAITLPLTAAVTRLGTLSAQIQAGSAVEFRTFLPTGGGGAGYVPRVLLRPLSLTRFGHHDLEVYDHEDPSKRLRFDLSGVPTNTTRTVKPPAAGNGELALKNHAHALGDIAGVGSLAAVNDAPADGTTYGRRNGAWAVAGGAVPHTHPTSEVVGLDTALAGKAASTHAHAAADITSGQFPIARLASGTPTGTKFIRDDGVLAAPAGGADPWTVVKLGADFATGSATAVDVTGMAFTPVASKTYMVEVYAFLRTATATVGPRLGCAWPTGCTDGVAMVDVTSAAATRVLQNGNINAAVLGPVGGLPNTTQSWPGRLSAQFVTGASPSGNFRVQLASETAATNVTMKAGSFMRYREV